MERRKIQKTGSSSYMVTLPKTWIELLGLKSGDFVYIHKYNDKLVITPIRAEQPVLSGEVKVYSDVDIKQVFRAVASMYLSGYDVIKIVFDPAKPGLARRINDLKNYIRIKLAGIEVIDETSNSLTTRILLNYEELSLPSATRRLHTIVNNMLKDSLEAFKNRDVELAETVIQRDDEADRFQFLIVRQLAKALQDIKIMKELGLDNPVEAINYRIIVRNLERIADHAVNIAKRVRDLQERCVYCSETYRVGVRVNELFNKAMDSFYKLSRVDAEETINLHEAILKSIETLLFGKIFPSQVDVNEKIVLTMVLDSLKRVARYSSGIVESALNIKSIKSREYEIK